MEAGEPGPLGTLLRQYRIAAGFTQEELAARAQVSARSISDLERGIQRVPYPNTIRRLKDALDLTPDQGALFQAAAYGLPESAPILPQHAGNGRHATVPAPQPVGISVATAREAATQVGTSQDDGGVETPSGAHRWIRAVVAFLTLADLAMYVLRQTHSGTDAPLNYARVPSWGQMAFDPERLVQPEGIATDARGRVYVADAKANRIFRFSASGAFLGAWGTAGRGAGELRNPTALAINHLGMIYVADTGNDRVDKFTPGGHLVVTWGSTGIARGQFRYPDGIAVDAQGYVYVSDQLNERIQVLAPDGHVAAVFQDSGFPSHEIPPYHIVSPGPLAIDTSGTLYAVDYGDAAVIRMPSASSQDMGDGSYLDTSVRCWESGDILDLGPT